MKICEDEVFGVLSVVRGNYSLRRTKQQQSTFWAVDCFLASKDKCQKPIVIVIESPHIKEFQGVNIRHALTGKQVSARPANGATGYNLLQQLPLLLQKLPFVIADGKYPVILVNAIQLQCSRGADTLFYRTRDFIHYWPGWLGSLSARLSALSPVLVINACTKGDFYTLDEQGRFTGNKAFNSGFDNSFRYLLENEFSYRQVESDGELQFMGTLDLSGLVMYQLDQAYGNTEAKIFKTTHPSSWGFREPGFSHLSNKVMAFSRVC